MLKRFNFRVTPVSMVALFVATVLYVAGYEYLAQLGNMGKFLAWLAEFLGFMGVLFLVLMNRALEMLFFVLLPYRTHVRERPVLILITTSVSYAASVVSVWLMLNPPWRVYLFLGMSYVLLLLFWAMFIYKEDLVVSKPV